VNPTRLVLSIFCFRFLECKGPPDVEGVCAPVRQDAPFSLQMRKIRAGSPEFGCWGTAGPPWHESRV